MPPKFYHGSNAIFSAFEEGVETRFHLLGKGIYFYQKWRSALSYGKNLYEIRPPKGLKIVPLDFQLADADLLEIFPNVEMPDMVGISKPLWWATDGWNIIGWQRQITIEKIVSFLIKHYDYDGMLADYPNGGLVLVLWRGYTALKPRLIEPPRK